MKCVFFDTETTGLPIDYDASYTDIDNWPRLVQLAWIVYNDNVVVSRCNKIIKPVGFTIPLETTNVHGISTQYAIEEGQKAENVLRLFLEDTNGADVLIGHNIKFDLNIILSELFRLNIENAIDKIEVLDTMLLSVDYCEIPSKKYGFRYPKLIELYNKLFSESFDNMHNAMADVEATAKCFWAMLDRGIIDREEYTCLLSEQEKKELAEEYNKQAIEIVWGTRSGNAEELYLKSAKLGNTEGMYKVALNNMGGFTSKRKDYETAKFWLEKIVTLSERQEVSWYKETLSDLIKIHTEQGNRQKVLYYKQLLEKENNKQINNIVDNAQKSESGYFKLVSSYYYGNNGFTKDEERAYKLIEEGIKKGYRELYGMYAEYLRKKGDKRYFFYLLEDIKDTEKELEREKDYMMKWSHNERTSSYMNKIHKSLWLTKKYRIVAEAYLKGFGVQQNIKEAERYLWKALSCDSKDYETTFLLARFYNGEFDAKYVNYDISISKLEALPLKYMDNKYPYALLGDAYFGKSRRNFFKASNCYDKYPEIYNYNSTLRKKYCKFRNIIITSVVTICALLLLFIIKLNAN